MNDTATRCGEPMFAPDLDPRAAVPDVCRETRQTVVDQIRGNPPTTVLGILVQRGGPVALSEIAEILDQDSEEVEWTVEVLEEGNLCARLIEDDRIFAAPFAPYRLDSA